MPRALAARFQLVDALPARGMEADLMRIRDASGTDLMLKLYRLGIQPNAEMWEVLRETRSRRLVRLEETGVVDGRHYELMEFVSGGTLRDLLDETGRPLPPALIKEFVDQLTEGLSELHGRRIIHRDLKPENILLRSRQPLDVVLADFGLSRYINQSAVFSSTGHTLAYTAPETLSNFVSESRDWWSLGIIVREMATGERPFADMLPETVALHLVSRPVSVAAIDDDRLRLLCAGLLVRDHDLRWGAAQVAEWAAGRSPDVAEERAPEMPSGRTGTPGEPAKPYLFREELYYDRAELAAAMAERWDETAALLFRRRGQALETLKAWLLQFDDPRHHDVAGRDALLDGFGDQIPSGVHLLRLLRWLDPRLPTMYEGTPLSAADLSAVAWAAVDEGAAHHTRSRRIVHDLYTQPILSMLDSAPGGAGLAQADRAWRELMARWPATVEAVEQAVRRHPESYGGDGQSVLGTDAVAAELLVISLDPGRAVERLRTQLAAGRDVDPPVPWWDELSSRASDDPLWLLAARRLLPAAAAQAERQRSAAMQQERLRAERAAWWESAERDRLAQRPRAIGAAFGGAALMFVVWLVFLLAAGFASSSGESIASACAMIIFLLQTGVEVALAVAIGGAYHPQYSLLQPISRLVGQTGEVVRDAGGCGGCLLVIAVIAVLGILTRALPPAVPLAIGGAYAIWTYRRWSDWQNQQARTKNDVLEGRR